MKNKSTRELFVSLYKLIEKYEETPEDIVCDGKAMGEWLRTVLDEVNTISAEHFDSPFTIPLCYAYISVLYNDYTEKYRKKSALF